MRADDGGECWFLIAAAAGAVIGGACSAISQQMSTGSINWKVVGVNAAAGAITGALASTGIGLGAAVAVNAAVSGATYVAEKAVTNKMNEISFGGVISSVAAGAVGGMIGGGGMGKQILSKQFYKSSLKQVIKGSNKYRLYNSFLRSANAGIRKSAFRYLGGSATSYASNALSQYPSR